MGKSTLLREHWAAIQKASFISFDRKALRQQAAKAPEHFLLSITSDLTKKTIIDEAQKVPDIFDAIKSLVDERRRPGQFTLSGSVNFSDKVQIRESLTGRIGIFRLYPLTIRELTHQPIYSAWSGNAPNKACNSQDIELWINRGGMPGMCWLRSEEERFAAWEAWVETACYKDLQQLKIPKLEGALALDILNTIATLEYPDRSSIAAKIRKDSRIVAKYLMALENLFILNRIDAHPLGVGKSIYYLFDSGLANYLGASREVRVRIWLLNEILAQHEYTATIRPRIYHYRSSKLSRIDFVVEKRNAKIALLISEEESIGEYSSRALKIFLKNNPNYKGLVAAPTSTEYKYSNNISVKPWTLMG